MLLDNWQGCRGKDCIYCQLAAMAPEGQKAALATMSPECKAAAMAAMSPEDRKAALAGMPPNDHGATLAAMPPDDPASEGCRGSVALLNNRFGCVGSLLGTIRKLLFPLCVDCTMTGTDCTLIICTEPWKFWPHIDCALTAQAQ